MATDAPSSLSRVSPFRAGLATMLIGAVILGVGMLRTTAATVQPECPPGTTLVAKFEYSGNRYRFEKPSGNEDVVQISEADAAGGKWTSSQPISVILVKGGPGSKTVNLDPPQTSGTFSNDELANGGATGTPDISNIQFCAPDGTTTTTTTSTSTTTEKSTTTTSTTTTQPGETTTTSTTTTQPGETTTTQPDETTTTQPDETTTTQPDETTTTQPGETTTTQPGETTTTQPDETTTTQPGETTTTQPGEVQGAVVVNTTIVQDDAAQVLAAGGTRSLPRTGAPSVPLVLIGIVLVGVGGTLTIVNRRREAAGT
jgi:LPXTG-motif cell wall-anchored protein